MEVHNFSAAQLTEKVVAAYSCKPFICCLQLSILCYQHPN